MQHTAARPTIRQQEAPAAVQRSGSQVAGREGTPSGLRVGEHRPTGNTSRQTTGRTASTLRVCLCHRWVIVVPNRSVQGASSRKNQVSSRDEQAGRGGHHRPPWSASRRRCVNAFFLIHSCSNGHEWKWWAGRALRLLPGAGAARWVRPCRARGAPGPRRRQAPGASNLRQVPTLPQGT